MRIKLHFNVFMICVPASRLYYNLMWAKSKFPITVPRWIKLAVGILTFVLLIATYLYRDDLFAAYLDPGQPFQTYVPPAAPNYATSEAWLAVPDMGKSGAQSRGDGDIFVVTPTVYSGGRDWVSPIDNAAIQDKLTRIITPNYVSPYQIAGRVYAPAYRHASLYSFMTNRDDAQLAQEFAYSDVARAFDRFLEMSPPERPIILIGNGQGGLHVERLLAEYFQSGTLAKKLAAAYVIDHPLPLDLFDSELKNTPLCESEIDTACVVAFGAFTPKQTAAATQFVSSTLVFEGDALKTVEGRKLACVNPLLWNRSNDYAPARLHKGAIAAEGLSIDASPAPAAKQFGAQCADGILIIDTPKQRSLRRPRAIGGRYKTAPFNLFYEDLRMNMVARTEALILKGGVPRLAPDFEDGSEIEIIDSPVTLPDE